MLDVLHQNYVDWMYACGGKGKCITCKAIVVDGMENLGELTPAEVKLRSNGKLLPDERLCCQAVLEGNVTIQVPELYKLPHVNYSE